MSVIKCKMCGGDLELIEGSSVAVCAYCGSQQTVPAADNEKKLTLFARANRLRPCLRVRQGRRRVREHRGGLPRGS